MAHEFFNELSKDEVQDLIAISLKFGKPFEEVVVDYLLHKNKQLDDVAKKVEEMSRG